MQLSSHTAVKQDHLFSQTVDLRSSRLLIEPTISAIIGQQNSKLTALRTLKAKGKKATTATTPQNTTKSTFSILDCDASMPVTIELGPFTFIPSAAYIVPLNVVDASRKSSFMDIDLTISLTIR